MVVTTRAMAYMLVVICTALVAPSNASTFAVSVPVVEMKNLN